MHSKRIAMLLLNPCTNDSRVVKQAEALSNGGYDVTVFCTENSPKIGSNKHNGVTYLRRPLSLASLISTPTSAIQSASSKTLIEQITPQKSANNARSLKKVILNKLKPISIFLKPFLKYSIIKPFIKKDVLAFQPNYIHCHDLNTLVAGIQLSRKLKNCKVIYDAHEMEQHRNTPLNKVQRSWIRLLERHYGKQADAVITVSQAIADFLKQELMRENVSLIYNSPTISSKVMTPTLRDILCADNKTPIISYVGGIFVNRGVEDLIRAIAKLDNFILALIGRVSADDKEELLKLATELNIIHRIKFIAPVAPEDVVPFISTSDIGAFAIKNSCLSYNYCMPNKLFEMSFAGLPIAASELHSVSLFLNEIGNGETFKPGDINDIAKKIKHIYQNKEQYTADQKKLDQYTWNTQVETLLQLYKSINN